MVNAEQFALPFAIEDVPCPFEFLEREAAIILIAAMKHKPLRWHCTSGGQIFNKIVDEHGNVVRLEEI